MSVAVSDCVKRFFSTSCAVLALLPGVISCTYDPGNEITFRQVEQTPVVGTFSLDNIPEGDTIVVYQTSDIQFAIGVDRGEIKGLQGYVGDRSLDAYVSDGRGTLRIYVGYGGLTSGTYTLSLEIISSSATKSVADNLGLETVTTKKSWPLKVDIDQPPAPNLKFSTADGFLKVSWDPYLKKNFASYKVTYSIEDYSTHYFKTRTIQISDPAKSFWIDSSYVTGYLVRFEVSTHTVYSFNTGRSSYHDLPQLKMEYAAADCTVTLRWTKAKFESALKSYTVTENQMPRAEILAISDTTCSFKINAICGQGIQLSVSFTPTYSGYRTWQVNTVISEPVPLETPNVGVGAAIRFTHNTTLNRLIAFNYNTRKFFSCDDNFTPTGASHQLSSPGSHPSIPGQGNYGYFLAEEKVVRFDLTTGEETNHPEPGVLSNTQIMSASGTGLVSMLGTIRWPSGSRNNFTQIKEFAADQYIYFKSQSIYESSPPAFALLSDDGQYAYFPGTAKLHRLGTSELTLIGDVPATVVDFRTDNNEELVTYISSGDVRIYNTADLSIKRTIAVPKPGFTPQFYDPVTNTVLFTGSNSYVKYIVNIDTGETKEIRSVNVSNYINGSLFITDTKYKKLL